MESGLSVGEGPCIILEREMGNDNKEDILMIEIRKYWNRGVRFSCGERALNEFYMAEALAEDERYMMEFDINMFGEVTNVNFQDIGQ